MLELRGVTAGYGHFTALWDVTLRVEAGEAVAVVGPNGSGKTTLMRVISGLVAARTGELVFEGDSLAGRKAHEVVRHGIAHVPEGRRIFPRLSVGDNLRMGAFQPRARQAFAESRARVYDLFPVLRERERQPAGSLSGGEQQMLSISRALMARPKMMLLDEPSLGLSPKLVKEIFDIIVRINRERGVTVLLVEQNANMALHVADYGYVLEVGRIVMEDACDRLLEKDDIKEFYLGVKESSVRGTKRWKRKKTWR